MFYHALPTATPGEPPPPWWCFHAETFTPISIRYHAEQPHVGEVSFTIVGPPPGFRPVFESHPGPFDETLIRSTLLPEIRTLMPSARFGRIDHIPYTAAKLPEYLIVWTIAGEQPAIIRTADPYLIIPAQPGHEQRLAATMPYSRTTVDLVVEGWAYWWEDAHRAWDDLIQPFLNDPSSHAQK